MAVGRGLGSQFGADDAVGTGAVVDHHRLAPGFEEFGADEARLDVARAAGWEGDD